MDDPVEIRFVFPDGGEKTLPVPSGVSIAEGARALGICEIYADCGFTLSCATCHVMLGGDQAGLLSPMSIDEDELLDGTTIPRQRNSRLSCQIIVSRELAGLRVILPERQ